MQEPSVIIKQKQNANKQRMFELLTVGRIDYHVQGTKPNADSAFAEYILCAHTRT